MENIKDYRVKITVRNNYLLTAMENAGINSIAELARRIKRTPTQLYGLSNLALPAFKANGQWRDVLLDAALALRCLPEDLMPPQHMERALPINSGEIEMEMTEVAGLLGSRYSQVESIPDLRIEKAEAEAAVHLSLEKLSERERYVVTRVHGLDGDPPETYNAISKHLGSRSLAHSIYNRAIAKLRRPGHKTAGPLKAALESLFTTDV